MATRYNNNGIDFMAISRGREAARSANWQDYQRQLQSQQDVLKRQQWADQLQELDINRQSQAYTAPLITNLQRATDAGVSPADFLIQQREQAMQDAAFQNMPPEVQERVLNSLGSAARAKIQDLQRTGQFSEVERLAAAFGMIDPVTPIDRASQTGDINAILATAGLAQDANGMVDINGTMVPAAQVALSLSRSGGQFAGVLPDAVAQINAIIQQKRQDAELQSLLAFFQGSGNQTPQVNPSDPTAGIDLLMQSVYGAPPAGSPAGVTAPTTPPAAASTPTVSMQNGVPWTSTQTDDAIRALMQPPAVSGARPMMTAPSAGAAPVDAAAVQQILQWLQTMPANRGQ